MSKSFDTFIDRRSFGLPQLFNGFFLPFSFPFLPFVCGEERKIKCKMMILPKHVHPAMNSDAKSTVLQTDGRRWWEVQFTLIW